MGVKKKLDRREATRERKALSAAKLERSIAAELLERLKSKAYGDAPLNVNEEVWRQVLDREKAGREGVEMEDEESEEEEEEAELEEEEEGWGDREFVSDVSGDEDGLSDLEDAFVGVYSGLVSVWRTECCGVSRHKARRIPTMKMTKTRTRKGQTRRKAVPKARSRSASGRHLHGRRSRRKRGQRRRHGVDQGWRLRTNAKSSTSTRASRSQKRRWQIGSGTALQRTDVSAFYTLPRHDIFLQSESVQTRVSGVMRGRIVSVSQRGVPL